MEYEKRHDLVIEALKELLDDKKSGRMSDGDFRQACNSQRVIDDVLPELGLNRGQLDERQEAEDAVMAILWQLCFGGIIVPTSTHYSGILFFSITEYGRSVLEDSPAGPYDPNGFIRRVQIDAPHFEAVTLDYLKEAVDCFRYRCFRASVTMLGVASEIEFLRLIDLGSKFVSDAGQPNYVADVIKANSIKKKFERFKVLLDGLGQKKLLPVEATEYDVWLEGTFQPIRLTRNDAGHANTGIIPSEVAYGQLNCFATYAGRISRLKSYLVGLP